jgi:hypothetical protein
VLQKAEMTMCCKKWGKFNAPTPLSTKGRVRFSGRQWWGIIGFQAKIQVQEHAQRTGGPFWPKGFSKGACGEFGKTALKQNLKSFNKMTNRLGLFLDYLETVLLYLEIAVSRIQPEATEAPLWEVSRKLTGFLVNARHCARCTTYCFG